MILTAGSTYGLTADSRWTCGVFNVRDDNGELVWNDKGELEKYELLFLGWATQVTSTKRGHEGDAISDTEIVPVFLDDCHSVVTLSDMGDPAFAGLVWHARPGIDPDKCLYFPPPGEPTTPTFASEGAAA